MIWRATEARSCRNVRPRGNLCSCAQNDARPYGGTDSRFDGRPCGNDLTEDRTSEHGGRYAGSAVPRKL